MNLPRSGRDTPLRLAGLRFAVIGAGRLGVSLALAMRVAGAELTGYTSNTPEGRARAEGYLGLPAAADLSELVSAEPDLYALTVPDAALAETALALGGALRRAAPLIPLVLHTSGASSLDLLTPCAEAGARTLVFHPLQTFSKPLTGSKRFAGAAVAVTATVPSEGSGPSEGTAPPEGAAAAGAVRQDTSQNGGASVDFGFALARALGARPFFLPDDKRALYHAAASVASNYLVTLEACAKRLFVVAGMPEDEAMSFFMPLVEATVVNLTAQGPVDALTGPLSRGDVSTIEGHLQALAASTPELLPVYRCLGTTTLDLVRARGDVDDSSVARLAALLAEEPLRPAAPSDPS